MSVTVKQQPVVTPQLAVQQAFDAFGNFFAATLRVEEDRQYEQANRDYPDRHLEKRELHKCGDPCHELFQEYLPKIGSLQDRAKFNKIIRDTILDPSLSTYQVQKRLLFTADQMAEYLKQRQFNKEADFIRAKLDRAGYQAKQNPKHHPKQKNKQSIPERFSSAAGGILQNIKDALSLRPFFASRTNKDPASAQAPVKLKDQPYQPPSQFIDAAGKLQELYAQMAKAKSYTGLHMADDITQDRAQNSRGVTYAFNSNKNSEQPVVEDPSGLFPKPRL